MNLKLGDIVCIVKHSQAGLLFVKFEEARRGGGCKDEMSRRMECVESMFEWSR